MKSLLNEGQTSLQELQELLKDIHVPIQSPAVAEAVQSLFGEGHKTVTFQMFLECLELTRNVGRATAAEYL